MSLLTRVKNPDQKSMGGKLLDSLFFDHNSYLAAAKNMSPEDFGNLSKREGQSVSLKAILVNIAVLGGALTIIGIAALFFGSLGGILALSFGFGIVLGMVGLLISRQSQSTLR